MEGWITFIKVMFHDLMGSDGDLIKNNDTDSKEKSSDDGDYKAKYQDAKKELSAHRHSQTKRSGTSKQKTR